MRVRRPDARLRAITICALLIFLSCSQIPPHRADSLYQSFQFARSEWRRVIPLPHRRVLSGSAFYVLYEVYSLRPDKDGQHRIEVTSELIARETRQLAVIPVPPRFISGAGSTATVVERVHTMDLKRGPYLLVSRILDINSGRTTSLTAEFEIAPALGPS